MGWSEYGDFVTPGMSLYDGVKAAHSAVNERRAIGGASLLPTPQQGGILRLEDVWNLPAHSDGAGGYLIYWARDWINQQLPLPPTDENPPPLWTYESLPAATTDGQWVNNPSRQDICSFAWLRQIYECCNLLYCRNLNFNDRYCSRADQYGSAYGNTLTEGIENAKAAAGDIVLSDGWNERPYWVDLWTRYNYDGTQDDYVVGVRRSSELTAGFSVKNGLERNLNCNADLYVFSWMDFEEDYNTYDNVGITGLEENRFGRVIENQEVVIHTGDWYTLYLTFGNFQYPVNPPEPAVIPGIISWARSGWRIRAEAPYACAVLKFDVPGGFEFVSES